MALAHRTVYRRIAGFALLAAFMLAVVVGCVSERSTSTSSLPFPRPIAGFMGAGDGETAHFFVTYGDWELVWICTSSDFQDYPYGLTISVMKPGPSLVMAPLFEVCENPSTTGRIVVHQSSEQWLVVQTKDSGGWELSVYVPQSDTGAGLVVPMRQTSVDR